MADRVVKYVFQGDIKGLQASMAAASASVGKFAKDATAADKEGAKFRAGLTTMGNTAGKIGLVAAAGLGAAIAVAANFDQAMSNVKAATHETAENMDALREAAIKAGADTAFSASEAAQGIENLAKAGVQTTEILGGGLQGALDLAAAGEMDVASAAEAAAGAMAQFKLEGDQVPHIADLLAAAAGKAQGDVSDMVMALKQAGTVSAQTGLTLEETTGALAAMAEQSLLGSDAGTSFKTMLAALTPNSEKAAGAMEEYNIHAFDAQGNFVGMTELAGQLQEGLGGLTDEQRAMTLETIFGSDAVRAASIIYDNGADGIAKWTSEVNDAGYASETAAIRLDNLKGDLEAFKGSIETALIGVGEGSQGPLRSLVQQATDVVNAFNKMPAGVQSSVTAVLGATAALGGGIFVGSKIIRGIADTREALGNLGIDATKTTKAMKGLAAASAGLAVGFAAAAAIRAIQEATDESLPGIETLTNQLLNIQTIGLADEFDSIGESLRRLTDKTFEERWGDLAFGQMGKVAQAFGGSAGIAGSVREATAEIDALDQAFAGIARQAGPEKAMETFYQFADSMNLTVSEQRDLLDRMPQLSEAFAGTANDADLAADGVAGVADEMKQATAEAYTLENAMAALFGKLDVDAATDAWRESIQGLTKDLEGGQDALNGLTEKGRENKAEIRDAISAMRARAEAEYEQTGNLDLLKKRLLDGRNAIIKQAKAANIGQEAMEGYFKQLGLTPKEIRTMVDLMGVPEAEGDIKDVQVKLSALDRTVATADIRARDEASAVIEAIRRSMLNLHDKTIYIRAEHTTSRLGEVHVATGGHITGPGTATSDSIPAYLSNGEYVVRAAAVDKYGVHMFDQMNAMRFAEGGSVQRTQRASTITTNNYGRSGPMQITGRLLTDNGWADITGIIDDRINAGARHDHATGRR